MGSCLGKSAQPSVNQTDGKIEKQVSSVQDVSVSLEGQPRYVPPKFPPPPPEPSPVVAKPLFIALYDYDARTSDDLSFNKGDILEVDIETLANDWWRALSRQNGREGYIPSNYVARYQTLEAEE